MSGCLVTLAAVSVLMTLAYVVANPRPLVAAHGRVLGPEHPCGAVSFVRTDPRWQQIDRDDDAALFVRADRRHHLLPGDVAETGLPSRSRCVAALQ